MLRTCTPTVVTVAVETGWRHASVTSCRAWTIARCDKIVSRLADRLRAEAEGKASGMSARSGASSQRLSGRADSDKESVRPAASLHATHAGGCVTVCLLPDEQVQKSNRSNRTSNSAQPLGIAFLPSCPSGPHRPLCSSLLRSPTHRPHINRLESRLQAAVSALHGTA
jgi:hypothetical protein